VIAITTAHHFPAHQFIKDVLDQPFYLRKALESFPLHFGEILHKQYLSEKIKKVILAGHGASYNALYPAFLQLSSHNIQASFWHTAELLHYAINQIDKNTLLILNSQSGQSAEILNLISKLANHPYNSILSLTNNIDSPLGENSNFVINLTAGEETGVATKTFFNSLGLSILLSHQICGKDISNSLQEMRQACDFFESYLEEWEAKAKEIDEKIGQIQKTIILGRGSSMSTAMTAALNQKEAARLTTEGMNAAEFRHGPLELADSGLTLIIIEGNPETSKLNASLASEVTQHGCHVLWVGNHPPSGIQSIDLPNVATIASPLAEILPLQILAYVLALRQKIEPGKFKRIGKVVLRE